MTKSAYISYYENHDIKPLNFKSFAQIITCKYQGFVKHFITNQGLFKHHMQGFILSRKPFYKRVPFGSLESLPNG